MLVGLPVTFKTKSFGIRPCSTSGLTHPTSVTFCGRLHVGPYMLLHTPFYQSFLCPRVSFLPHHTSPPHWYASFVHLFPRKHCCLAQPLHLAVVTSSGDGSTSVRLGLSEGQFVCLVQGDSLVHSGWLISER